MALLNKLFSTRRRNSSRSQNRGREFLDSSGWRGPAFSKDQIRVLVFRECEVRGRKLLFDWKSVRKSPVEKSPKACKKACPRNGACQTVTSLERSDGLSEVAHNGIVYQYLRPKSDVKMLGEMVFGSVAMSYKGVTIKIHHIRQPPQLMFCKVVPSPGTSGDRDSDGCSSLSNSISDYLPKRPSHSASASCLAHSVPVDVPHLPYEDDLDFLASSSLRSNGSFGSAHSFQQRSPEGSTSSLDSLSRSGSYNSLQRRWTRSLNTSMEHGLRRMSSDNVSREEKCTPNSRRTKLGISVVISLSDDEEEERHFRTFFFSHVALIEGYLNKLSDSVTKAYVNRRQFVHLVMEGVESLQQSLYDLYVTPRFPDPVWLSMMAPGAQQHKLSLRFMTEFMRLLDLYDNKNTKYFVSTLLTAVLTHHLAWVSTVTPAEAAPPSPTSNVKHTPNWLDQLAKFQPYNPLWVQLCDLYGAVGAPFKVARTVVVGENAELVRRVLYCLTYFVRCSQVYENVETRVLPPGANNVNPMATSASSVSSVGTLVGETPPPQQQQQQPSLTPGLPSGNSMSSVAEAASEGARRRRSIETISEGVERQEGEGDESEVDDEVFEAGDEILEAVLRDSATPRGGTRRHGVIYDSCPTSSTDSEVSTTTPTPTNATFFRHHPSATVTFPSLPNGHVSLDGDRDSGIDSFVDTCDASAVQPSSLLIVRNGRLCTDSGVDGGFCSAKQLDTKPVPAVRSRRRRGPPGKVVFTIGNIPLTTQSRSEQQRLTSGTSPVEEALVCTCGKHVAAGAMGGVAMRPRQQFVCGGGGGDDYFGEGVGGTTTTFDHRTTFSDESSCTFKSPSAALDSGIHSCENSDLDLATESVTDDALGTRKMSVSVLDILPPPVRLEHVRSLGKSLPSTRSLAVDAIERAGVKSPSSLNRSPLVSQISGSKIEVESVTTASVSPSQVEIKKAARRYFESFECLERSNSMFDEYFDGNVELKMLDEESFRQQIRSRFQKQAEVASSTEVRSPGEPQTATSAPTLRRVSRDSMLDAQDVVERSCAVRPTDLKLDVSYDNGDDVGRTVLWNTSLPTSPVSPTPTTVGTDRADFFDRVAYMQLPTSEVKQSTNSSGEYQHNFGWSLASNFSDHYMSDFALQGTRDTKFGIQLCEDLRNGVQHPVLDENIVEAVSIVADTNKWTVEVISDRQGAVSESGAPIGVRVTTSQLVVGMTESLLQLWKLKMSPEFCLMHLEDRLQEFFFKSCLLADYFRDSLPLDVQHVSSVLDLDSSDLPLLLAICLTHSPEVPCTFGISYR